MCRSCDSLIKAIDRYIAMADDDLADELEAEGRAEASESVEMMSDMEDGIATALVSQTDYFIKKIKSKKSIADLMDVLDEIKAGDACSEEITAVALEQFKKHIPKLVVSYANEVDSGIKITAVSKRTTAWVESWSKELGDLMQLNSHTEIENILKTALENGDSIQTVTQTILESGIRDEYYKARRVAMTEMFRAHNLSRQEAMLQSPCVTSKMWRHLGIGTPRPYHEFMDGMTVPKDEPFELIGADGETYYPMYPVDPCLPAGEAVNCHCIAEEIIDQNILGLSIEERQQLRDEALKELDEEWEKEVDAKYRALVGLSTEENVEKGVDVYSLRDIMNEWDESLHPRDENGRFTDSGGATDVSATGANKFERGFSQSNGRAHWGGSSDHSAEYIEEGIITTRSEYKQRALELIQSPVGDNILGYKIDTGQIVRYDKERNDFVKGNPKQGIATMFKPKDGEAYYNRQLKKDGGVTND